MEYIDYNVSEKQPDYVISDLHFYHQNIIGYEKRPFKDYEEMNNEMIKRWNNTVKKQQRIFVLGDFALTNPDNIKKLIDSLNGIKILIMGNHDQHIKPKRWMEMGFAEVYRHPILVGFYIFSHYRIYLGECSPYVNIYGHSHTIKSNEDNQNQYLNVCVENINYTPISFLEIRKMFEKGERMTEEARTRTDYWNQWEVRMTKIKCVICGEEFQVFNPAWNRKYCRACAKTQQKESAKYWKKNNPDKVRANKHKQWLKHKEKYQQYYQSWYEKNKERLSIKRKERYRTDEAYRQKCQRRVVQAQSHHD